MSDNLKECFKTDKRYFKVEKLRVKMRLIRKVKTVALCSLFVPFSLFIRSIYHIILIFPSTPFDVS